MAMEVSVPFTPGMVSTTSVETRTVPICPIGNSSCVSVVTL